MRERIKLFIAACFYYGGPVKLLRWWTRCSGQRLIILNYHQASGGNLRSHLLYLRRHYRLLHLHEALEELSMPPQKQEQRRDRRTPLVLTFDDGYHDNYTHGLPLARELAVPITIFLVPGYIESENCFWWMANKHLLRYAQVEEVTVEGRLYHLKQPAERNELMQAIDARLRYAGSVTEREQFLAWLREALAVPASAHVEEAVLPLTWAEVRAMEESGWVSFGAHTMHHPILAYLKDRTELQHEVSMCRTVLEQHLGHPVHLFAYPVGKAEHIGAHGLQAVREAGYTWAVTTIHGTNTKETDPYQLRRIESGVDRHWLVMAAETVGLWQVFSSLKQYTFTSRKGSHLVKAPVVRGLDSKRSMS
jgi:peptidoglycan/xylan/chitin deacetylase (PgdA/CDA1 family)